MKGTKTSPWSFSDGFGQKILALGMTIKEAFVQLVESLRSITEDREAGNIAQIIFEDVFHWSSPQQDRPFTSEESQLLAILLDRLQSGEPLQYVLGVADFYGLKFKVDASVLIPRPETEELVFQIISHGKKMDWQSGLDIGTGTGCIAISLKKNCPEWSLSGLDVSEQALEIARENAAINEVEIDWLALSILDEDHWVDVPKYDFIVSNPPYIPYKEKAVMSARVIDFEPDSALFVPDDDPFLFYRTIIAFSLAKLKPHGALFFEVNEFNGQLLLDMIPTPFYSQAELLKDLQGKDRILYAQRD